MSVRVKKSVCASKARLSTRSSRSSRLLCNMNNSNAKKNVKSSNPASKPPKRASTSPTLSTPSNHASSLASSNRHTVASTPSPSSNCRSVASTPSPSSNCRTVVSTPLPSSNCRSVASTPSPSSNCRTVVSTPSLSSNRRTVASTPSSSLTESVTPSDRHVTSLAPSTPLTTMPSDFTKDKEECCNVAKKFGRGSRGPRKQYTPDAALKALRDMDDGLSGVQASIKWGIPRSTLIDLKKGRYSVYSHSGPPTVLTKDEELLLCNWLIEMCRRGMPINKRSLLDTVQKILTEDGRTNPFKDNRPGDSWYNLFIARHPHIAERTAEAIDRCRGSLTEECLRGWFRDAKEFFCSKRIEYVLSNAQRQYNGDETGFQLDPKAGHVLAPRGENVYTEAGSNKEQITVLVTTRADGVVITPCIVYPYKRALPNAILEKMPSMFCQSISDSGWMTSAIFFEYLANIFIPELSTQRRKEKGLTDNEDLILTDDDWVVYWIDGYSSHLTLHTSQLCDNNNIILYCFKSHSSHICQPNDVGPFKPLKTEWRIAVTEWRQEHPYEYLTRVNFAPVLARALGKLNPEAIIAGYRATGLFPFNVEAVHFEKLTTGSAKRKYGRVPHVDAIMHPSTTAPTNDQIVLDAIEEAVGTDVVNTYHRLYRLPVINQEMMPPINAYFLWSLFKNKINRNTIQNEDENQNEPSNGENQNLAFDPLREANYLITNEEIIGDETSTDQLQEYVSQVINTSAIWSNGGQNDIG